MGAALTTGKNTLNSTLANILRRFVSTSATTLSIGVASVLGYAIYRSYLTEYQRTRGNSIAGSGRVSQQLATNFQEPDIGHAQRTKEEVDQVGFL